MSSLVDVILVVDLTGGLMSLRMGLQNWRFVIAMWKKAPGPDESRAGALSGRASGPV